MKISLENVNKMDLEKFKSILPSHEEFYKERGEHYKLLSYFSTLFDDGVIFDVGTHHGSSALAFSFNKSNTIHTFDIEEKELYCNGVSNVKKHICNILYGEGRDLWEDQILKSDLIFIDIDPHEGKLEYDFVMYLKEKNYNGVILCDDIWYFKGMRDNFWYKIDPNYRYDLTDYGHWSGTGAIYFGDEDIGFKKNDISNWTLVTGYFDLTKCPDASDEINRRNKEYYMESARSTLSLNVNLVVFCEEENLEIIKSMRPKFLEHKTQYIVMDFEKFPLTKYRNKIITNRISHPYNFDKRNTASYYLFCMSRYHMLKTVIDENKFGSTHFAWINFCIERMGHNNLAYLEEILACNRNKFSTCYIDYIPKNLIDNVNEYFKWGRCSMCSGFFTGNKEYMYKVCQLIEDKFMEYLDLGYGHADEQLFSPVYFENKDLFEFYFGDYLEMISNYKYMRCSPEKPVRNFLRNSLNNGEYKLCLEGCKFYVKTYMERPDLISNATMAHISMIMTECFRKLN